MKKVVERWNPHSQTWGHYYIDEDSLHILWRSSKTSLRTPLVSCIHVSPKLLSPEVYHQQLPLPAPTSLDYNIVVKSNSFWIIFLLFSWYPHLKMIPIVLLLLSISRELCLNSVLPSVHKAHYQHKVILVKGNGYKGEFFFLYWHQQPKY